jgi:hypothetical protein
MEQVALPVQQAAWVRLDQWAAWVRLELMALQGLQVVLDCPDQLVRLAVQDRMVPQEVVELMGQAGHPVLAVVWVQQAVMVHRVLQELTGHPAPLAPMDLVAHQAVLVLLELQAHQVLQVL